MAKQRENYHYPVIDLNEDEFSPMHFASTILLRNIPIIAIQFRIYSRNNLFLRNWIDIYKKKKEKNRTARKLYFSTIVIFINLIRYLNCRYKPKIKFFSPSFNRFNDFNFLNFTPNLTSKSFRRNFNNVTRQTDNPDISNDTLKNIVSFFL